MAEQAPKMVGTTGDITGLRALGRRALVSRVARKEQTATIRGSSYSLPEPPSKTTRLLGPKSTIPAPLPQTWHTERDPRTKHWVFPSVFTAYCSYR